MMSTFAITHSRAAPSGRVGGVPISMEVDTGADAVNQAFTQLGNRLYQIGEQQANANNALKTSELRRRYDELGVATENALKNVTDDAEAQRIIGKYQTDVSALKSGTPDVDDAFTQYRNNTITRYTSAFADQLEKNKLKEMVDTFDVEYQASVESGDQRNAVQLIDNLHSSGAITKAKAESLKDGYFADHVLTKAQKFINTGDAGSLAQAETILSSMSKVAAKDQGQFTAKQLDTMSNARSALIQANNRLQRQARVNSEEAEKDLIDKMADYTMTLADVKQYRGVLDADTYKQYAKIAMNPEKKGNNVQEAAFRSMAGDIWSGGRNEQDVRKLLLRSLADPDGISTQQYTEISARIDSETGKLHSQARREVTAKAARVILDRDSSAITIDINGNMNFDISKIGAGRQAEFERKMHYVDLYNRAVDDLIASNPTISRRDLYAQASALRDDYVKASRSGTSMPESAGFRPLNPDPIEFPDAEWSEKRNAWVVERGGRRYEVGVPK